MTYTIVKTPSLVTERTGFEVYENGNVVACGFCATEKLETFVHGAVKDAKSLPYEEIRKTFLTGIKS